MNAVMIPTLDYVCAPLVCPRCGRAVAEPCAIDMQVKISRSPDLREYVVGDPIDLREDLEDGGYLNIGGVAGATTIRVIETWACPSCGANFLWARLTIEGGKLTAVETTDLSETSLRAADYITSQVLVLVPVAEVPTVTRLDPERLRTRLGRLDPDEDTHHAGGLPQ